MSEEKGTALQIVDQPRSEAIEKRERPALEFTEEQRKIIRDSYAGGATEQDFKVLMEIAKAKRLNPLLGQIHFVQRYDSQKRCQVWSCQTSIDGFRSTAEDTGLYDGQDEPEFEYTPDGSVLLARVKTYRKDIARAFVGVAYYTEYAQTTKEGSLTNMWRSKPHIMIAKCAEALALRKAFPQDLGQIYIKEEFNDDGRPPAERLSAAPAAQTTAAPALPAMTLEDAVKRIATIKTMEEHAAVGVEMDRLFPRGAPLRAMATEAWKKRWAELNQESKPPADLEPPPAETPAPSTVCDACGLPGSHAKGCPQDPANAVRQPGEDG